MNETRERIRNSLRSILETSAPRTVRVPAEQTARAGQSANTRVEPEGRVRSVLAAVQYHIDQTGNSPTYQEIASYTGIPRGSLAGLIYELAARGFVERDPERQSRNLQIVHRLETLSGDRLYFPEDA